MAGKNGARTAKTVAIFDIDDLLYISDEALAIAWNKTVAFLSKALNADPAQLGNEIGGYLSHRRTSEWIYVIREMAKTPASSIYEAPAPILNQAIAIFEQSHIEESTDIPGSREAMQALHERGVLIIGMTNTQAAPSVWKLKAKNFDGLIHHHYTARTCDTSHAGRWPCWGGQGGFRHTQLVELPVYGELKPCAPLLRKLLNHYGVDPVQAVFFGNSWRSDGATAIGAGVEYVHCQNYYRDCELVTNWGSVFTPYYVEGGDLPGRWQPPFSRDMILEQAHRVGDCLQALGLFAFGAHQGVKTPWRGKMDPLHSKAEIRIHGQAQRAALEGRKSALAR
ncbi:MAG: HAD family hydrolase [Dongiaceae bacterium]